MKTYACIMAGGSGERFWPLSRIARPKHLVPLLSETTLLEETVRRVEQALPSSHIFVLTNAAQIEGCRAVLPRLKAGQFIAEPAKRDTAPSCALGTALVGAATVGNEPSELAVDAATHTVYVANGFNDNGQTTVPGDTVSVIDTRRCDAWDVTT